MKALFSFMLTAPLQMVAGGTALIAQIVQESLNNAENDANPPSDAGSFSESEDRHYQEYRPPSFALHEANSGRWYMYDDEYGEGRHDASFSNPDKMKYVDFEIRFAKADHQALLREESGFPVNYATDSNSFSALRLGDFMADLAKGLPIPVAWRGGNHPDGDYGYRRDAQNNVVSYSRIPDKDKKHVEIKIKRVDDSTELKEATEVDAIREVRDVIREEISGVRKAIEEMWD